MHNKEWVSKEEVDYLYARLDNCGADPFWGLKWMWGGVGVFVLFYYLGATL